MKEKNSNQEHSIQQSYPSEMRERQTILKKQKLKEFINTRSILQEILKEIL